MDLVELGTRGVAEAGGQRGEERKALRRAAEVAASRGDLGAVFAVDGSIMGANSGKSPSMDGVAPPPRATAL